VVGALVVGGAAVVVGAWGVVGAAVVVGGWVVVVVGGAVVVGGVELAKPGRKPAVISSMLMTPSPSESRDSIARKPLDR
jgi:hypothetical protein